MSSIIHSLRLSTPFGKQKIFFSNKIGLVQINNYDTILLVVDRRVHKLKATTELIASLEKESSIPTHICLISINNYTKNTKLMCNILDQMSYYGLSRKSLVISIGGGATADAVGVSASIYMRGIDYAVVATSFISMADSIISKVAVNHGPVKNMIGAFRSPKWTLINPSFIDPDDKVRIAHGLVEVWKHALLERDAEIIHKIDQILEYSFIDKNEIVSICRWSLQTKAKYVIPDWDDSKGLHKALSLGHTLANYLEMNDSIHHGEAVLYGILFESILARNKSVLSNDNFNQIISTAKKFELHFKRYEQAKMLINESTLLDSLVKDKISQFGKIKFVLPTDRSYTVDEIEINELTEAVSEFQEVFKYSTDLSHQLVPRDSEKVWSLTENIPS